jgi:hypothetical protein
MSIALNRLSYRREALSAGSIAWWNTSWSGAVTACRVIRISDALRTTPLVNASSSSAGSKSSTRFHSAMYGDAGSCAWSATARSTAVSTPTCSLCSSICRSRVARLS